MYNEVRFCIVCINYCEDPNAVEFLNNKAGIEIY